MKTHFFAAAMCLLLAGTQLTGCANASTPSEIPQAPKPVLAENSTASSDEAMSGSEVAFTPKSQSKQTKDADAPEENPDEQNALDGQNALAEKAYMDFLHGKAEVVTAQSFGEDDANGNFDGLEFGSYNYASLKSHIAELEMNGSITKYTLLDFGQDGVKELVLRFENTDPSFMNWTGIIRFRDGKLNLNYAYEDGYRTSSTLYTSGYLFTGGSYSAGASSYTLVGFDKDGFGTNIFYESDYYGPFAAEIAYDLQDESLSDEYADIAGKSEFFVREYKGNGVVKLSVSQWSTDAAVLAREEALINDLVALGAEQITEAEMDKLCNTPTYGTDEPQWLDWSDGVVSVDYAPDELLAKKNAYDLFIADESEYQVKALFSADETVTDLRILALEIVDVSEEGEISFSAKELYQQAQLTPEKPLVVGMVFWGDTPSMGISYVDRGGSKRVYSINMSGMDSSLLLAEANLV